MKDITYIGNSLDLLKQLLKEPEFRVKKWIFDRRKIEAPEDLEISLLAVASSLDLRQALSDLADGEICIMHSFGFIIPEDLAARLQIFNIHSGSLTSNRGRNPVEWAILLGWEKDEISLHKIDGSIDGGVLIATEEVKIEQEDTPITLRKKYQQHFPALFAALAEYLDGKRPGNAVCPGIYRPRVSEQDYTIDLASDDLFVIRNKIRSQAGYNGAVLWINGEKHYIHSLTELFDAGLLPKGKS